MNYSQSKTKRSSNREITMKPTSKPKPVERKKSTPAPMPKKAKSLTGDKAAEAMRKRTSPKGVKEYEKGAKKALDKKYPGLYKKTK
jgi:hypothetical protein